MLAFGFGGEGMMGKLLMWFSRDAPGDRREREQRDNNAVNRNEAKEGDKSFISYQTQRCTNFYYSKNREHRTKSGLVR